MQSISSVLHFCRLDMQLQLRSSFLEDLLLVLTWGEHLQMCLVMTGSMSTFLSQQQLVFAFKLPRLC